MQKKSQIVQAFLILAFGPAGLFYSSVGSAFVMMIFVGAALAVFGFGFLLMWPIMWLVGISSVSSHNAVIKTQAQQHRELIEATRVHFD